MNPASHHRAEFFLQWKLGMCGNQTPHSTPGSLYIAGPRGPATSFNCGQWGAGHLLTGFEAAAFQWVPSGVFGELTMAAESPEHGLLAALALQRRTFVPTTFVFLVFLVVWSRISDDLIVAPGVAVCVTMGIIIAVYMRVKQATERAVAGVSNKCAELATRYPGSSWEAQIAKFVDTSATCPNYSAHPSIKVVLTCGPGSGPAVAVANQPLPFGAVSTV